MIVKCMNCGHLMIEDSDEAILECEKCGNQAIEVIIDGEQEDK